MPGQVECARCHRLQPALERDPYPGALGEEIRTRICAACWSEWQEAEVIVINELRLNFMEPRAQEILIQQLREFLCLDSPKPGD